MPPRPATPKKMAFDKYRAFMPLSLPDRTWPNKQLVKAPRWCPKPTRTPSGPRTQSGKA